jgi:hypothetical protein
MPENEHTEMEVESVGQGTEASRNMNQLVVASQSQSQSQEVPAEQPVVDASKDGGRKGIEPRSEIWQHFIQIKNDAGIMIQARCKYCSKNMKAEAGRHGTSSLKRHFAICKRNPHKFNKDPTQGTLQATNCEGISTWKFDQTALRAAFAEMIIEDELPFCFGEKSGFRKFMSKACPRFQVPSRRTCTRDAVRCFFQEKAKLRNSSKILVKGFA